MRLSCDTDSFPPVFCLLAVEQRSRATGPGTSFTTLVYQRTQTSSLSSTSQVITNVDLFHDYRFIPGNALIRNTQVCYTKVCVCAGQCWAHQRCALWSEGVCQAEDQSLLYVDRAIHSGSTEVRSDKDTLSHRPKPETPFYFLLKTSCKYSSRINNWLISHTLTFKMGAGWRWRDGAKGHGWLRKGRRTRVHSSYSSAWMRSSSVTC